MKSASMLERLTVPARHYNERIARLRALREEVDQEVREALDVGLGTMPMSLES